MLVHRAGERGARVLDFFASRPGKGLAAGAVAEMEAVELDYDGSGSEVFLIGAGSCAVPGNVAGLAAAHRAYATLPWRGADRARRGAGPRRLRADRRAELPAPRSSTSSCATPTRASSVYGRDGERFVAGDQVTLPDLGGTLERLAEEGAGDFYDGELARAMSSHVRERGRPAHARRPARVPRRATASDPRLLPRPRVRLEPAAVLGRRCSSATALRLLERLGPAGPPGSADELGAARRGDARDDAGARRPLRDRPAPRRPARAAVLRGEPGRGRGARARAAARARRDGGARHDAHLRRGRPGQRRVDDRARTAPGRA